MYCSPYTYIGTYLCTYCTNTVTKPSQKFLASLTKERCKVLTVIGDNHLARLTGCALPYVHYATFRTLR